MLHLIIAYYYSISINLYNVLLPFWGLYFFFNLGPNFKTQILKAHIYNLVYVQVVCILFLTHRSDRDLYKWLWNLRHKTMPRRNVLWGKIRLYWQESMKRKSKHTGVKQWLFSLAFDAVLSLASSWTIYKQRKKNIFSFSYIIPDSCVYVQHFFPFLVPGLPMAVLSITQYHLLGVKNMMIGS